jgi:hypothetical protein
MTTDDHVAASILYDAQEYLIAGLDNQAEWWEHLGDAHRDYAKLAKVAVAQAAEIADLKQRLGYPEFAR